jgi:endonuclease G
MVQLRRNYTTQGKGLPTTFRLVLFFVIAVLALAGGLGYMKISLPSSKDNQLYEKEDFSTRTYLPSAHGEIVHHKYYSLSYIEKDETAEWTAYMMNRSMLNAPNVERYGYFSPDNAVTTGSAIHSDYSNSGYTRGHLVPAGDMAFDTTAMRESFFMSNMTPQLKAFNNGVWKELEEDIRDWTYESDTLYIISGPVLSDPIKTIGKKNKVTVPSAFYKVILDYTGPEKKAIGFIIPHELSEKRLETYMVTVDEVERLTGIDFFGGMIDDTEEEKLESQINKSLWKVSDKRYQLRIKKWNYE